MQPTPGIVTYLFSDIEGSTRLWEQEPERMRGALARHDAISRHAVESNHGRLVKTTGDGVHAVFSDPLDAVSAALALQQGLADSEATGGIALRVRCGLHAGVDEQRDDDFFGRAVNRAARVMASAHGGQVLASQAVAGLVADRLEAPLALRELGSVRLRGLARPERVYQLVHPSLREEFPPLRSLDATPNNLPAALTSFVGRERDLSNVQRLLGEARLVTLTGVGGIGKTRLSLEVARRMLDDFADGAWFVELAPLRDGRLVPHAIASILGVTDAGEGAVLDALATFVQGRRLLVVLDNCEHVADACAAIAGHLLHAGAQIAILASSREPLRVPGETVYRVPTLSTPADDEAAATSEAVELFVERARAAQPQFALAPANARIVAAICRRLDGIPLAIELAAARTRSLGIEAIAARLDDRFRLLGGGDRTALPRQQTLRALIDWSYELLDERERALLRRLSVFSGGFTLDAVEAVCGDDARGADVLDALTGLVEKSLALFEAEHARYGLLETVRLYAHERLDASGEGDALRDRHLAHFLSLAETARPQLFGPEQGVWLAHLDGEYENLLAAHRYADRAGSAEAGLRLVHALKQYWVSRGLFEPGRRMCVEALGRADARSPSSARCRALFSAGVLEYLIGAYGAARVYLEESLAIARAIDDRARVAMVLQPLGMALLGERDLAGAREALASALALAREGGDKREIAAALCALAQVRCLEGGLDEASTLCEAGLALARELDDRDSVAVALLNLAMIATGAGSLERARRMLQEAHAIAMEIGSKSAGQSAMEISAGLCAASGDWERAARLYGAAQAQTRRSGRRRDPADEAFLAPRIAKARDALGPERYARAEASGASLSYDDAMREACECFA